jgi:hypothetical protein
MVVAIESDDGLTRTFVQAILADSSVELWHLRLPGWKNGMCRFSPSS